MPIFEQVVNRSKRMAEGKKATPRRRTTALVNALRATKREKFISCVKIPPLTLVFDSDGFRSVVQFRFSSCTGHRRVLFLLLFAPTLSCCQRSLYVSNLILNSLLLVFFFIHLCMVA